MIPDQVLAQLSDIETPPPAGLWPPAPGWWLLAVLLLLILILGSVLIWRRHQRHAPRREALAQLAALSSEPDRTDWYAALNRLLKQTAVTLYPTDNPLTLTGNQWRDFLARTSDVPGDDWEKLIRASYQPASGTSPVEASRLAERWIRRQPW